MIQEGEKRIINKIVEMAEAEIKSIMADAQSKAEDIKKEAAQKANAEAHTITTHGTQEAKRERQRIIADARLKAKRKMMSMQEKLMQESFERSFKYLQGLFTKGEEAGYHYGTIITNFIREAAEIIGQPSLQLTFNERDKKRFQPLLPQLTEQVSKELGKKVMLSLADKTISTIGGVNVKSEDGTVGVDNTIEARMSRLSEGLKAEVTRILF